MEIKSNEASITEQFQFINNKMITNEQGKRIDWLINNYLTKIATDESGWFVIYQDQNDERYWELTYPNGEMQGGGARLLKVIPEEEAISKYNF